EQFQIAHEREQLGPGIEGRRVEIPACGGYDAQALFPEPMVLSPVQLAEMVVERNRPGVWIQRRGGAGQELIGGPLHETADHLLPEFIDHVVERCHELVFRIEAEFSDSRKYLP